MHHRFLALALFAAATAPTAFAADVSISGGVDQPGAYPTRGQPGLIGLILKAGGLSVTGCTEARVVGEVEGKSRIFRVNLWELMADFQPDWALRPGDRVFVEQHETTCVRDGEKLRALMTDYLASRAAGGTPPAKWRERLQEVRAGCGRLSYERANQLDAKPRNLR